MTKAKPKPCPFVEYAGDLKRTKEGVEKHVLTWISRLGLEHWDIDVNYHLGSHPDTPDCAGMTCADWRYKHARIDFYLAQTLSMSEEDWEMIALHELLHVVVNEMQNREGPDHDHEERVVTELTRAFLRCTRG